MMGQARCNPGPPLGGDPADEPADDEAEQAEHGTIVPCRRTGGCILGRGERDMVRHATQPGSKKRWPTPWSAANF